MLGIYGGSARSSTSIVRWLHGAEGMSSDSAPMKVLIADDNPGARLAIATMVKRQPGVQLVGEAENGDEAFRIFEALHPDLVITDLEMPGQTGLMLAEKIIARAPATRIVLVTATLTSKVEGEAARLGVACLSKVEARDQLPQLLASFIGEPL